MRDYPSPSIEKLGRILHSYGFDGDVFISQYPSLDTNDYDEVYDAVMEFIFEELFEEYGSNHEDEQEDEARDITSDILLDFYDI